MKWRYISVLLLGFSLTTGCNQEDDIIPTEGTEKAFVLPQGDHDYDEDLVTYYKKYGFMPVYQFTTRDIYWNNTEWIGGDLHPVEGEGKLIVEEGDPEYVGKQWDLCKKVFLDAYPDNLLKQMPLKFYMCRKLGERKITKWLGDDEKGWGIWEYDTVQMMACSGYDYIAANLASPAIDTISDETKLKFSKELNALFMTYLQKKKEGIFTAPEEFFKVHSYSPSYGTTQYIYNTQANQYGFVTGNFYLTKGKEEQAKQKDFADYMLLITVPLEQLEKYVPATYASSPMEGALHPMRDTRGYIRKKYEILIKYMKEEVGINTDVWQYPLGKPNNQ